MVLTTVNTRGAAASDDSNRALLERRERLRTAPGVQTSYAVRCRACQTGSGAWIQCGQTVATSRAPG